MTGPHLATVENVGCTVDRYRATCTCGWTSPLQVTGFQMADRQAQLHIGQRTLPLDPDPQLSLFTDDEAIR